MLNKTNILRGALALAFLGGVPACYGTSLTLASLGTAVDPFQTNDWAGPGTASRVIVKNSAWADPLAGSHWISFGDTGAHDSGFFVVPNGTTVDFTDIFQVYGLPTSGTLTVLADDTTSVWLNGTLLLAAASDKGNHYHTCSDSEPGCLTSTESVVDLTPALHSGTNTLVFGVEQKAGDSFGLDYAGSVTSKTPEPATMGLMGMGLVLVSFAGRKLRRKA